MAAGSHHVLVKPGNRPITVPVHRGRAMKEPIARAILKQAGVSERGDTAGDAPSAHLHLADRVDLYAPDGGGLVILYE
jgi:hypothetical protein